MAITSFFVINLSDDATGPGAKYRMQSYDPKHTFWTDGYFACSEGNVSEEMLQKYIENQG